MAAVASTMATTANTAAATAHMIIYICRNNGRTSTPIGIYTLIQGAFAATCSLTD